MGESAKEQTEEKTEGNESRNHQVAERQGACLGNEGEEKKLKETDLNRIRRAYPNLDYYKCDDLQDINGKVVGRKACHVCFEE